MSQISTAEKLTGSVWTEMHKNVYFANKGFTLQRILEVHTSIHC